MKSGLLDDMPKEHREQLERRFETRAVAAGEVIFQEGDPADRLYLVKSGRVRIEKSDLDVLLVTVEPGEEFGAMAALDGSPRSARAVAAQDTVLLSLSAEALEDLAREHRSSAL